MAIASRVLRACVLGISDVGDVSYELLKDILFLCPAAQLRSLEELSPHLIAHTGEQWKALCVHDFVAIRAAVEDGKMVAPPSWRDLHEEEFLKKEAKLAAIRDKMRGQYDAHKDGRGATKPINGVRELRNRKPTSSSGWSGTISARARPAMSLMDKARASSARISSSYARPKDAARERKTTALAPASLFGTGGAGPGGFRAREVPGAASSRAPVKVVTTKRSVMMAPKPRREETPKAGSSAGTPPPPARKFASIPSRPAISSPPSKSAPRSPPPLPLPVRSLSSTAVGSRQGSAGGSASPPPPPPPTGARPAARPLPGPKSLFMPAKRRKV